MADEQEFIDEGLRRTSIDQFFEEELGRAGYGGMDLAQTPMGTQIVLKAEKPGMVIGKGGKNIRAITTQLEERFNLEDPQIDVQEVDEPDLNARIVADRLANALERGWYFRKAGHTTLERIMDAGALGAEIVLSGKVTGQRSRVEKFNDGYIKHNGEPAETIVDHGQGTAVMKLGTIGVDVKIIPPGAHLPDDFEVVEGADVGDLAGPSGEESGVDELLADDADEAAQAVATEANADTAAQTPDEAVVEDDNASDSDPDVEEIEAAVEAETNESDTSADQSDPEEVRSSEDLEESVEEQAAAIVADMEEGEE